MSGIIQKVQLNPTFPGFVFMYRELVKDHPDIDASVLDAFMVARQNFAVMINENGLLKRQTYYMSDDLLIGYVVTRYSTIEELQTHRNTPEWVALQKSMHDLYAKLNWNDIGVRFIDNIPAKLKVSMIEDLFEQGIPVNYSQIN